MTKSVMMSGKLFQSLNWKHEIAKRLPIAAKFMNPIISLGYRNSRRLAVLAIFDADVAGLLPLPSFRLEFDLLDFRRRKYFTECPFADQGCVKLQIKFIVAIEGDAVAHGRTPFLRIPHSFKILSAPSTDDTIAQRQPSAIAASLNTSCSGESRQRSRRLISKNPVWPPGR